MLVLALGLILVVGLVGAATLALAVHARARAQNAADLAALAGADLAGLGVGMPGDGQVGRGPMPAPPEPGGAGVGTGECPQVLLDQVRTVATANGAVLLGCLVDRGTVLVEVSVTVSGPAGAPRQVTARARAGAAQPGASQ